VKNTAKNHQGSDSYGASDAAAAIGVSVPTVKRMVRDGTLEGFRTPGGHLRVTAESIETIKDQARQARPVREPSPVLQNRRERLEELTLEAQEHRARRELTKLRREEQEEADRLEAEAQARETEAAQRQAELELERERLAHEKAQERARLARERAQECERREAERELAAFHNRWLDKASEGLAARDYAWLTAGQRKEVLDRLEPEIKSRQTADEPRMALIIARSVEALTEPLRAERDAQERRQKLTDEALRSLPYLATEAEKVRAAIALREALSHFDGSERACNEIRMAAQQAVEPVRQAIERRLLNARLIAWALWQLPRSRSDHDEARIRRECAEILAELPVDITEPEGRDALESTIKEACVEIEKRQAERERQARKTILIAQGVAEVRNYLAKLKADGEISSEDYWDSQFTTDLNEAVQRELGAKLTGDETSKEIREHVRRILDDHLG
jgi:excisionase family DNA binding protein